MTKTTWTLAELVADIEDGSEADYVDSCEGAEGTYQHSFDEGVRFVLDRIRARLLIPTKETLLTEDIGEQDHPGCDRYQARAHKHEQMAISAVGALTKAGELLPESVTADDDIQRGIAALATRARETELADVLDALRHPPGFMAEGSPLAKQSEQLARYLERGDHRRKRTPERHPVAQQVNQHAFKQGPMGVCLECHKPIYDIVHPESAPYHRTLDQGDTKS